MPESWALDQKQALSLDHKIILTCRRIREWHDHYQGRMSVSYSGGKDSTVLLDLVRRLYPDTPAMFCNTGLEYPEIVDFVKRQENITILRPRKTFKQVIEDHGYPVVSKVVARAIQDTRRPEGTSVRTLRLTGYSSDGRYMPSYQLPQKWRFLIDAPFKVSDYCCEVMKKQPAKAYHKKQDLMPMIGTMAADSRRRRLAYMDNGCNAFHLKSPVSAPLSVWTENDVLEYIATREIDYCSVYGDIVQLANGTYATTGQERTGCIFCMFGLHLDRKPNRFQQMRKTHPKLLDYCLDELGLREVLEYLGEPYEPDTLFDIFDERKADM